MNQEQSIEQVDWRLPTKTAAECTACSMCGEPFCDECGEHYADCPHPGPHSERGEVECDACGSPMRTMGHCKYLCQRCGFLRTCLDTI